MYKDAHILIVDDLPQNAKLLKFTLEDAGYTNLATITDPREIQHALQQAMPDLLLLDLRMPYISGYDVLNYLNTEFGSMAPPVIVLTAQNDDDTRKKAFEHGALNFLTKPFDQNEVLTRVENVLKVHYVNKESRAEATALQDLVEERTEELRKLSLTDPLTGLPNRRALRNQLVDWLWATPTTEIHAFFIVVHDAQAIANVHGYNRLESLMKSVADLLQQRFFRKQYFLSSWGGHEFVMITHDEDNPEQLAQNIAYIVDGAHVVDNTRLFLTSRIGIAKHEGNAKDQGELIDNAALAVPPQDSAEPFRLYQVALKQALEYRSQLVEAIKQAIKGEGFKLVYQPKVQLNKKRITSAEALLRFESASLGQVSPADFIPVAEDSGCIIDIGNWVLDEALKQLSEWIAKGAIDDDFHIAINVAAAQLLISDFAGRVISRLEAYQLPAHRLQLEVTESSLMENIDLAVAQLARLAEYGVETAIDDFGTGYSSLSYMRDLPVSILKIDRSFIDNVASSEQDLKLVETVVDLANHFNLQVVAEGIETEQQYQIVEVAGCDYVQGYLISKPLAAEHFVPFIADYNH